MMNSRQLRQAWPLLLTCILGLGGCAGAEVREVKGETGEAYQGGSLNQALNQEVNQKENTVKPLELPDVQRFTLDNGLTILVVENHQVPYAAFRLLFKTGSLQDPEGKEGLAKMTTSLLTYGTNQRSEDEINEQVDSLGASLGGATGRSNMQVYGDVTTVSKSNLRSFFDLMVDVVRNPTFPEDALDRMKKRTIGGLMAAKDDNSRLAGRAFAMKLFEGHPYGRVGGGHPKTLKSISREDIQQFHKRYFLPEHAVLGVSGDVNPEEIVAWAKEAFMDGWGGQNGQRVCVPMPDMESTCSAFKLGDTEVENRRLNIPEKASPLADGIRVVIVDRQDPSLNQVQWRMGHQGDITFNSPNWHAFRLGTQLLGGDFTARLNQVLRVREGLTYGARLNVQHGKRVPGSVAVSTYVKPKDLRRAIELALNEMETASSTPIEKEEIESFKSKLIEGLPFRFETAADTLAEYIGLIAGDREVPFLENFPVAISEVDSSAAQAALQQGVRTDKLLLVVVANASIEEELKPLVESRGGSIEVISVDSLFQE